MAIDYDAVKSKKETKAGGVMYFTIKAEEQPELFQMAQEVCSRKPRRALIEAWVKDAHANIFGE